MPYQRHELKSEPPIAVVTDGPLKSPRTRLHMIDFNDGQIEVHSDLSGLRPMRLMEVAFATLGMSRAAIGHEVGLAGGTVSDHLRDARAHFHNQNPTLLGNPQSLSPALARYLLKIGVYDIDAPGKRLGLNEKQISAVTLASKGATNARIGDALGANESTATGWMDQAGSLLGPNDKSRELTILAGLMSGEVAYWDMAAAPISDVVEPPRTLSA